MNKPKAKEPCRCGSGKKFKRCCMFKRYCYLDETGNTGLNFFDSNQEFFIQGCAISGVDLDVVAAADIKRLAASINKSELHANDLGIGRLRLISAELIRIIQEYDVHFIFTVFEKKHYLTLTLFHLFYDGGLNPAVNPLAHGVNLLRMILAWNFSSLVTEKHLDDFWRSTQTKNIADFTSVLDSIRTGLSASELDSRTKELLGDALSYTILHPEKLFGSIEFDRGISVNFSAFGMMINLLNQTFKGEKVTIERLVHDTQKEFGSFLKRAFSNLSTKTMDTDPLSLMHPMADVHIIKPRQLTLVDSSTSVGLQLTDIGLWIFKRLAMGDDLSAISDLTNCLVERHFFDGVTRQQHQDFVINHAKEFENIQCSPEKMEKGKALLSEVEMKRWKRSE